MARVDPIFRDIELMVADIASPQARSANLAAFAAEQIEDVLDINRAATGRAGSVEVIVDGKAGAPLASVKPNGVIVANFDLIRDVLDWIGEQLLQESPRLTGRYMRSHVMFVDGVEHDLDEPIPDGEVYEFVNTQPYARKIEGGFGRLSDSEPQSAQAPHGVYQVVAAIGAKRFGNIAKVHYGFRQIGKGTGGGGRQPAIIVRPL